MRSLKLVFVQSRMVATVASTSENAKNCGNYAGNGVANGVARFERCYSSELLDR